MVLLFFLNKAFFSTCVLSRSPDKLLTKFRVLCSRESASSPWVLKVDPKTTESVREASRLLTNKEAKMAKEYQALKERNQLMEAQLESMR